MARVDWKVFAAIAVALLTGLVATFGCTRFDASSCLIRGTFFFLATNLLLLVGSVLRQGAPIEASPPRDWSILGAACALTALIFFCVPVGFRVLSDETNLVSTSLSFYSDLTFNNIVETVRAPEGWQVVSQGIPTRPGSFPFLVSLVHFCFGFRPEHAFAVNLLVAVATLVVVAAIGCNLGGRELGLTAALFLSGTPLFALAVTSGGFEALNLLLFLVVVWQSLRFLRSPTPLRWERLLLLTSFAAQVRYESILLTLLVAAVGLLRRRELLRARFSFRLVVAPLLFLPALLLRTFLGVAGTEGAQPELQGKVVFSVGYVAGNVKNALELFFDPAHRGYPIARPLPWLAVFGLVLLLARLRDRGFRRALLPPLLLLGGGVLLFGAVYFSFLLGDLRTAFNMRLAVVFLGPLALLGAYPVHRCLLRIPPKARLGALGAMAAALLVVELPVARENRVIGELALPREYARNLSVLRGQRSPDLLVVAEQPGLYAAQRYEAIAFPTFERRWKKLQRDAAARRETLVVQHVMISTGVASPSLSERIPLRTVTQYRLTPWLAVRISKLLPDDSTQRRVAQRPPDLSQHDAASLSPSR